MTAGSTTIRSEAVSVREVTDQWSSDWDAYVQSMREATFFHLSGWHRVISSSFGHKPHYLQAMDTDGNTRGILPLFEVKSLVFGHSLVSTPFCVYGGAVADTPEIRGRLEDRAAELAEELGVDYLELRYKEKTRDDWPSKSVHSTFVREIEDGGGEAILLSVKNKQRAVIRKGIRNDLDRQLQSDVSDFFEAYSTSVRNLGTPVFSKKFFRNLKKEFGEACEIISIRGDGKLHCALISFYFRDQVLPYYGGGMPISRQSKAMDFMYYDLMCRAANADVQYFDFGRSKNDSGPYNYKRHWGFEPQPLNYQYFLVKNEALPELNVTNPRYEMMIRMWKKLPLKVSQIIGPMLSKYLG